MKNFRDLIQVVDGAQELLSVQHPVAAQYELAALLKQAEARRKAIMFESVSDSPFRVVGGLLSSAQRMGLALGHANVDTFTRREHATLIKSAMQNPLASVTVKTGACQDIVTTGEQIDCAQLPIPTFFAEDSGPFLTAAVGVSRNPDTGVLNVGIYRVLMLANNQVAVSASPSSDLLRFFGQAAEQKQTVPVALVIGPDPAVLMAAAAKVPADISEFDVAGALNGAPLALVAAETSDLLVPADAEFVLEVEVDPNALLDNQMGEFGDFYGAQAARVATVTALTHREDPIFHTIMAGAGREHNNIGFIILYDIEPTLEAMLADSHPEVCGVRIHFEPPRMGVLGEAYLQVSAGTAADVVEKLLRDVFEMRCGMFDIARVIRCIIVVDADINLQRRAEIDWAVATRANTAQQVMIRDDLAAAGNKIRIGINATSLPADRERLKRLIIPGSEGVKLDDYLR